MGWHSVQLAKAQPMNMFHCRKCDMLAAESISSVEGGSKLRN
jgi:hypothetical protein